MTFKRKKKRKTLESNMRKKKKIKSTKNKQNQALVMIFRARKYTLIYGWKNFKKKRTL